MNGIFIVIANVVMENDVITVTCTVYYDKLKA